MSKMTFALKEGKLVDIDSVDNGLACGCKCLACDADLVARNNGVVREHHFAHRGGKEPSSGYDKSIVSLTGDVINKSGKLFLPPLSIQNSNESKEIVKKGFLFEYCNVDVLDRREAKGGGYYTLLLLTDKKGNKLEVIVSCGVKTKSEYVLGTFENSRIEIMLDTVEIYKLEDLNKILTDGILNSQWIYSKKAEYTKRKMRETSPRIYRASTFSSDKDSSNSGGISKEAFIREEARGIKDRLPKGICPYCAKSLKVLATNDFEMLCCSSSICSFKAEINRVENTIEFREKYGERTKIVLPIPEKFKTEEKVK